MVPPVLLQDRWALELHAETVQVWIAWPDRTLHASHGMTIDMFRDGIERGTTFWDRMPLREGGQCAS